ncbi:Uncharacterised protein [Streptococcus pneumoniae]|nr:Uncharacterised protein [Streptococcus pneumoniae]
MNDRYLVMTRLQMRLATESSKMISEAEESGTIVSYLQKKQRICRCFFAWLR